LQGGQLLISAGASDLGVSFATTAFAAVRNFTSFTPDSDLYEEHDCGFIEIAGKSLFWKIDYYDHSLEFGSNDPADEGQTKRVLTIMLADES
jgi:hypothetical protein